MRNDIQVCMYVHHYFIKGIFSFVYLYCCYLPLDLEHVRQQCSFMHTFFITMQLEMQCLSMKQPFTRCNAAQSLFTCLVSAHPIPIAHACVSYTMKTIKSVSFCTSYVKNGGLLFVEKCVFVIAPVSVDCYF